MFDIQTTFSTATVKICGMHPGEIVPLRWEIRASGAHYTQQVTGEKKNVTVTITSLPLGSLITLRMADLVADVSTLGKFVVLRNYMKELAFHLNSDNFCFCYSITAATNTQCEGRENWKSICRS